MRNEHQVEADLWEDDSVLNLSITVEYVPDGEINPKNSWFRFWKWRMLFYTTYQLGVFGVIAGLPLDLDKW
jgi:hypothetical protein